MRGGCQPVEKKRQGSFCPSKTNGYFHFAVALKVNILETLNQWLK
jgi:hypothetical protein